MSQFSEYFAEAWAAPTADKLVALLHEDVVLRQPQRPPIHGKAAARADFQRLLNWLPELYGVVDRYLEQDNLAFIEWRLQLPTAEGVASVPAIDRFVLEDGLGKERVVFFDQIVLNAVILKNPRLWPGALRYGIGR